MSTDKDLMQLSRMVAGQHGWPAAKTFKSYVMNDADSAALSQCAVDVLKVFPKAVTSSALIGAALAVGLESRIKAPIQVVAGTLSVEGVKVFGDGHAFDGAQVFSTDTPDWDGHVWLMIGGYVVDIAIFRAAYSATGPAALARHVNLVFGTGKALYVDLWKRTAKRGLSYEPKYVLTSDEVTRLMGGAFRAIKGA